MAYHVTGFPGAQDIAVTSTTQKHPLGTVVKAVDPDKGEGEFVYLKGVASTAVGDFVSIVAAHGTARLDNTVGVGIPCAVAMSANVANQYGWYAVRGRVTANFAGAAVAGAAIQATGTAGAVDDTAVAGDYVSNAIVAATVSGAGAGDVYIHYPVAGLA